MKKNKKEKRIKGTKVECKWLCRFDKILFYPRIKGTKVECKLITKCLKGFSKLGIKGTKVECKCLHISLTHLVIQWN